MADRFDRVGNGGGGGGSFVMGLLTGTVLGAGLGMMFASKAGAELRSQLSEQAGNLANTASEGYRQATENASQWAEKGRDAAGEWAEKGKNVYGKAREAVKSGFDAAEPHMRDTASGVTGGPPTAAGASVHTSGSDSIRASGSVSSSSTGPHSGGGHSGDRHSGSTGGSRSS
jgi:gas vesicle protein